MYCASLDARLRASPDTAGKALVGIFGREKPDQIHALGKLMCLR